MWTLVYIGLIWAIACVLILLFFKGAKTPDNNWDGLHHREGDNEKP